MNVLETHCKLPPKRLNHNDQERRVGIEIELAGLAPVQMVASIQRHFGGDEALQGPLEYAVLDSQLGNFKVELDSSTVKRIYQMTEEANLPWPLDNANTLVKDLAEDWVPWELVSPPIPVSQLDRINELVVDLRNQGALGTRESMQYAFGMHLNPDLPDLSADTILKYFQAYLCLYDGIAARERPNFTRQLTPHIRHFDKDYIVKVIAQDYAPDIQTLMKDYIEYNPTRNRSLDLLPLFQFINEDFIKETLQDPKIQSRPTFHFRLPNSDIDNPNWGIHIAWHEWLAVEWLAQDSKRLQQMCSAYGEELDRFGHHLDNNWQKFVSAELSI